MYNQTNTKEDNNFQDNYPSGNLHLSLNLGQNILSADVNHTIDDTVKLTKYYNGVPPFCLQVVLAI